MFAGLAGSYALSHQAAKAELPVFEPDLVSTTWEENEQIRTGVSLNGKELATFKNDASGVTAEQRAEQFATKLRQVLNDDKFDANKLLPGKDGDSATAKIDGVTVLKFDNQDGDKNKNVLEQGYKSVNSIRNALGAAPLPQTYLKLAELVGHDNPSAKGNGGCFSGHASWYGGKFHGRKTSDGHRYDQDGLTAAHRSLPFGTKLLVMNRRNGQSCVVQVNDRGPFVGDRVIDLSRGAARQLNMLGSGVAVVDCLVLGAAQ
jgi:rare lipoprotein A